MATMADVARLAGVSVSTVSYALTGTRPITAATRARVELAMSELGYVPNAMARGLRGRRSKVIALLYPTSVRGLDLSALGYIVGASDRAQASEYHLLLWTTEASSLATLRNLVRQGLVDGVLMMEVRLEDPRIQVLEEADIPFLMIGRNEDPQALAYVDTDFEQSIDLAVGYLADLGHRRLAFVNSSAELVDAGLGGPRRLTECARRSADARDVQIVIVPCDSSVEAGRRLIEELLNEDPRITGVIGFNEQAMPGIIAGAAARGLAVPGHLSLVAVALADQAATMVLPPLTTVSPDIRLMGQTSVEMLIQRLEGGPPSAPAQRLFPGHLTVRGTSGPAPSTTRGA